MGRLKTAAAEAVAAAGLHETSVKGLYFRPLGFGDLRRFDQLRAGLRQDAQSLAEVSELVDYVVMDLLKDEDGAPGCDSREEMDETPPQVILALVNDATEYFMGNVPTPPAARPAPRKSRRKRT